MGNVKQSFVAQSIDGGVVFAGPTGVLALPTSAAPSALTNAWKALDLGTLAEDGLSIMYKRSSKDVKDFDGADYVSPQDDFSDGFKATFLDVDNLNLVKSVYGTDNVTVTAANGSHGEQMTIFHAPDQLPFQQAVVAVKSGAKRKLYVAEICRVTEIAEIKDVYNDATKYEVTWKVFRGSDGKFLKEYRDNGVLAVPANYTVTINGSPAGGTFTLSVGGQTTSGIAYNAAPSAVDSALEALSTVGTGNATVTGSAGGPYAVTLANGGVLTASGAGLTGGTNPSVTVS
ncbi:hypothetical protein [Williamsia serinedens]|uniref:hypothetical protein n=1 Tax=Williamsia serinedens TaxID=391736 RepID=UPI002FED540D